jgi:Zn-dependent peptidase ImmA (M78 family)/DNA-binding XRE family transcriptional regulator
MTARLKARVKGALLEWARKTAGYAVDEAAKRLHVKPDQLSAWESDDDAPTINQLRNLARAYRRPLSVFYLQEVPKEFMVMHDFRRLPGEGMRRYSPALHYEIRAAQQRRELALELIEDIGERPPKFPLRAQITDDPEDIGRAIRDKLKVPYAEQITWRHGRAGFNNWRAHIEAAGVLVFQATRVPSDEISGMAIAEDVLPVIVVNRKNTPNRRTFSLLHEFAHLVLRLSGISELDVDARRPPEDQKIEIFCNRAAAAALMPREKILGEAIVRSHATNRPVWGDQEIEELARIYSVSREAVLRRLLTFGRTTAAFYREKRTQYVAEYQERRTRERELLKDQEFARNPPQEALGDFGRPFVRLVLDNYYQDRITLSDVSGYLGVRVRHVPKIEQALGPR